MIPRKHCPLLVHDSTRRATAVRILPTREQGLRCEDALSRSKRGRGGVLVNRGGLPTEFATRGLGGLLVYQGGFPTRSPLGPAGVRIVPIGSQYTERT